MLTAGEVFGRLSPEFRGSNNIRHVLPEALAQLKRMNAALVTGPGGPAPVPGCSRVSACAPIEVLCALPLVKLQCALWRKGANRVAQVGRFYRTNGLATARLVRLAVRGRRQGVGCIRLVRSGIEGFGAAAAHPMRAGDQVVEYRGEVVRMAAGNRREAFYEKVARVGSDYMFRNSRSTVLDATVAGSAARFLNHSCTPNCGTRLLAGPPHAAAAVAPVRPEVLEAVGDAAVERARRAWRAGRAGASHDGTQTGTLQAGGEGSAGPLEGEGEGEDEGGSAPALGMARASAEGDASFQARSWDRTLLPTGEAATRVRIDVGSSMVHAGEELCYDYKFPLEHFDTRRIACWCGTPLCTGHMN